MRGRVTVLTRKEFEVMRYLAGRRVKRLRE